MKHTGCDGPCRSAVERSYPRLRSGAAAERRNPTSKDKGKHGCRTAERSYSTFKVRRGGPEEIPLIQSNE